MEISSHTHIDRRLQEIDRQIHRALRDIRRNLEELERASKATTPRAPEGAGPSFAEVLRQAVAGADDAR